MGEGARNRGRGMLENKEPGFGGPGSSIDRGRPLEYCQFAERQDGERVTIPALFVNRRPTHDSQIALRGQTGQKRANVPPNPGSAAHLRPGPRHRDSFAQVAGPTDGAGSGDTSTRDTRPLASRPWGKVGLLSLTNNRGGVYEQ